MGNGLNLLIVMLPNLQQNQETKMTIAGASNKSLKMIYTTRNYKLCFQDVRVGPSNHDPMREMGKRPLSQDFLKYFLSLL